MRTAAAVAAAAVVAFLGWKILAEYPFDSWLPIVGAALLGLVVTGVAALVLREVPPVWLVGVCALLATAAEYRAVLDQRGPKGRITWEGYAAIAAAAAGGLWRLRSDRAERAERARPTGSG